MSIGVYVHIPFCHHKCSYCDFNAYSGLGDLQQDCVDAICHQIRTSKFVGSSVRSIFLGGGTPTLLNEAQIAKIMVTFHESFDIQNDAEITTEANPTSADFAKFRDFYKNGFNRISIGVQNFTDSILADIERTHSGNDAVNAVQAAVDCGFENISVDLMFGLPGQSVENWRHTLIQAADLPLKHISAYALTIESGTRFERLSKSRKLNLPSEDDEYEMFELARSFLPRAGFLDYEISNYCIPGFESIHNTIYWQNEEYMGFGPGAVSYMNGLRWTNTRHPRAYVKNVFQNTSIILEAEELTPLGQLSETIIASLRLTKGVELVRLKRRFGDSALDAFASKIAKLKASGLLEQHDEHIRLTTKGVRWANDVMLEFLP